MRNIVNVNSLVAMSKSDVLHVMMRLSITPDPSIRCHYCDRPKIIIHCLRLTQQYSYPAACMSNGSIVFPKEKELRRLKFHSSLFNRKYK